MEIQKPSNRIISNLYSSSYPLIIYSSGSRIFYMAWGIIWILVNITS